MRISEASPPAEKNPPQKGALHPRQQKRPACRPRTLSKIKKCARYPQPKQNPRPHLHHREKVPRTRSKKNTHNKKASSKIKGCVASFCFFLRARAEFTHSLAARRFGAPTAKWHAQKSKNMNRAPARPEAASSRMSLSSRPCSSHSPSRCSTWDWDFPKIRV